MVTSSFWFESVEGDEQRIGEFMANNNGSPEARRSMLYFHLPRANGLSKSLPAAFPSAQY